MSPEMWSRLRHTRFVQIVFGYALLCWPVFAVLDKVFQVLGLPLVASQVALVVLIVGFFVVAYVAWIHGGEELAEMLGPERARRFDDLLGSAWVRRSATVGLVALVAGGGWIALRDRLGPEPLGIPELLADGVAPRLVVLPFDVEGVGAASWRNDAVEFLGAGLDGISGVEVLDRGRVVAGWGGTRASDDSERAIRFARDLGGHFVVTGTVHAERGGLRVAARVFETAAGRQLGSEIRARGSADDPAILMDSLAIGILRSLEAEDSELARVSVARARTSSPAAFRAFVAGEDAFRRADFAAAIARYQEALAADSTFALAELRLGLAASWPEETVSVNMRQSFDHALRHGDRLDERHLKLARAAAALSWSDLMAIDLLRELAADQEDAQSALLLGDAYYHFGQALLLAPAAADSALAVASRLDPGFAPVWIHRIHLAFQIHADSAAAAAMIDSLARYAPDSAVLDRSRQALALAFGDPVSRARIRGELGRMPASRLWALAHHFEHPRLLGLQAEVLGHLRRRPDRATVDEARQRLVRAEFRRGRLVTVRELLRDPTNAPGFLSEVAYLALRTGLPAPPDLIDYALTLPPEGTASTTSFYAGAHAAELGSWRDVEDAVNRLWSDAAYADSQGDWEGWRMLNAAGNSLDAYAISLSSGAGRELLERLATESSRISGGSSGWPPISATVRWWIANMAKSIGDVEEEERALLSLWNDPYAALRLARLYAAAGRQEEARERAGEALAAWSEADPEIAGLVAEARAIQGR